MSTYMRRWRAMGRSRHFGEPTSSMTATAISPREWKRSIATPAAWWRTNCAGSSASPGCAWCCIRRCSFCGSTSANAIFSMAGLVSLPASPVRSTRFSNTQSCTRSASRRAPVPGSLSQGGVCSGRLARYMLRVATQRIDEQVRSFPTQHFTLAEGRAMFGFHLHFVASRLARRQVAEAVLVQHAAAFDPEAVVVSLDLAACERERMRCLADAAYARHAAVLGKAEQHRKQQVLRAQAVALLGQRTHCVAPELRAGALQATDQQRMSFVAYGKDQRRQHITLRIGQLQAQLAFSAAAGGKRKFYQQETVVLERNLDQRHL